MNIFIIIGGFILTFLGITFGLTIVPSFDEAIKNENIDGYFFLCFMITLGIWLIIAG